MKHFIRSSLMFLLPCLFATPILAQTKYVYSVQISECKFAPRERVQTGFRVKNLKGVITALHGVVDAGDIRVYGEEGAVKISGKLRIAKVDIARDIALLLPVSANQIAALPDDGLEIASSLDLKSLNKLQVYGYPIGLQESLPSTLILRTPQLKDLRSQVPPGDAQQSLMARHSPDLSIKVLSLEGWLLPGHSGAPILDQENRVVAVGNGGLRGGVLGICWAVPWNEITLSEAKGNASLALLSQSPPAFLFSTSLPAAPRESNPLLRVTESAPNITQGNVNYVYNLKNIGSTTARDVRLELVVWANDRIELNYGQSSEITISRARIANDGLIEKAYLDIKRVVSNDEIIFTVISSREIYTRYSTYPFPLVNAIICDEGKGEYVPNKPKERLLVGNSPVPGYKSSEHPDRINIQVAAAGWGEAEPEDVQAVLQSAANELLTSFPNVEMAPIFVKPSPRRLPRMLYERGPNGEYVIELSARGRLWAKFAFQFTQMLCRLLINPDRTEAVQERYEWFETSFAEAVALANLNRMAVSWRTSPPYPNWQEYAASLSSYVYEIVQEAEYKMPASQTLATWYKDHQKTLEGDSDEWWGVRKVVTSQLLPMLENNPQSLEALSYLRASGAQTADSFGGYLSNWQSSVPAKYRKFVERLTRMFGL